MRTVCEVAGRRTSGIQILAGGESFLRRAQIANENDAVRPAGRILEL